MQLAQRVNQYYKTKSTSRGVDSRYQGYTDFSFLFCLVTTTNNTFLMMSCATPRFELSLYSFSEFSKRKGSILLLLLYDTSCKTDGIQPKDEVTSFSLPLLEKGHDLKIWNISVEIIDKKYQ